MLSFKDFCDALHDHFAVTLVLVLKAEVQFLDNFNDTNASGNFHSGFNELFVISFL